MRAPVPGVALGITLVLLATACGGPKNVRDIATWTHKPDRGLRVGIVPSVTLATLEGQDAPALETFRRNAYVGRVRFAGGYEILPEEDHQARSVVVDLTDQDAWEAQGLAWLDTTIASATAQAGWEVVELPAADWVVAPARTAVRGSSPFDGTDNVNLPRVRLSPAAQVVPETSGVDLVMVPILVHYYGHNAGWFVGQEMGCWGGARTRVLWSLYRPGSGGLGSKLPSRAVAWGDLDATAQAEGQATPNLQQLQDLVIQTETEVAERLSKRLRKRR